MPLRGVEEAAFEVHREVQIVEGRRFENGKNELIVGRGAAMSFKGLEVGNQLQIGLNQWTVVGQFTAEGGVSESELWTGTPVLQQAYRRGTSYQSVLARLESGAAFDRFKAWLAADPRLNVKVGAPNRLLCGTIPINLQFNYRFGVFNCFVNGYWGYFRGP